MIFFHNGQTKAGVSARVGASLDAYQNKPLTLWVQAGLLMMVSHLLSAQEMSPQENTADPQVENASPSKTPPVEQPSPVATTSDDAPVNTFDVLEYQIEGNTLLKRKEVEKAIYPYLGKNRTIQDASAARESLEKVYRDRGYLTVLVELPAQKVENGVVKLHVIEAAIEKLRVKNARYYSLGYITDSVPSLAEGSVPNFNQVQKELALVNKTADRRVLPLLKASETPGKVDVDLKVEDQLPLHASLELNNQYSANTSHTRLIAQARYDNLFQRDHSISMQYQVAPENIDDAKVISLSYVIPTQSEWTFALYGVQSRSSVSAIGTLGVIGDADIFGIRAIQTLPNDKEGFYHRLTYGVDRKKFKQSVLLQGQDAIASPITYWPLSLQYSANWYDFAHPGNGDATGFEVGLTTQIRNLGSDREEFANRRFGAGPSFYVLRGNLQHEEYFNGAFLNNYRWFGRIDFQLTDDPLISPEGMVAGGVNSVRGYTESERIADSGVRLATEFRTPSLASKQALAWLKAEQAYAFWFADYANIIVNQAQIGQPSNYALTSTGLGFRLKSKTLDVGLDWTHAFATAFVTKAGDERLLFRVNYGF